MGFRAPLFYGLGQGSLQKSTQDCDPGFLEFRAYRV